MYEAVGQKLARGDIIILDGGTGTEIQAYGVPMHDQVWCAEANRTHPDIVRRVHSDYIAAGADVITANTFPTSPLLFNALGRDEEIAEIDHAAVRLAREAIAAAGNPPVAVAGSFSIMRPVPKGGDRSTDMRWTVKDAVPLMRRKAEILAECGCDLILMEMMRDCDYSLWATEAAVATGLPVWVGISVERGADGKLIGLGRPEWAFADVVSVLMATGAKACLVMHNDISTTPDALQIIKSQWSGPIGAYPESGYFEMPDWKFVDIITPGRFVVECQRWHRLGATILGGCCGIGPSHIKALAAALKPAEAA
jgi:homocysteine S-methyltransferase